MEIVDIGDNGTRSHPDIFHLLGEAKQKIGAVRKGERNSAQNFNFRGVDTVVNATAPVFNYLGIVVTPEVTESLYEVVEIGKNKTPMGHVTLTVKYTFYGPGGDSVSASVFAEAMDSGDKAAAKAMSVAYRIALLQVLNLPTDEPDPDSVSYERSERNPPVAVPTLEGVVADIRNATTIQELRNAWKAAGAAGVFQSECVNEEGEKCTVQAYLYQRHDELSFPGGTENA